MIFSDLVHGLHLVWIVREQIIRHVKTMDLFTHDNY